ncbi:CLUMA_CG006010, isoform A [Clunio marinus]|uniref:CLUMA_CG006010, isoform A n=1 Tax=Clunio marinus TaxID=568069 RepID=A0A1J1HWS9_9DIPT|nr:CLUMA_CG006010, isoform A [Clunio marinus]
MIMDKLWIISLILSTAHKTNGQSSVEVQLITKKYVEKGSSTTLYCRHNVDMDILYKVAWLRSSEHKFFEYINNRIPPYRNFSTPGADIDFSKSNESQVTLMNVDFDATAGYYCEVSIDNPIFTKASNEEHIHVIVKQTGSPKILFKKKLFVVGENLIANCTTTRAKPHPHITWLINGKKVDDIYTKTLHPYSWSSKYNRSKPHHNNVQQSTQNKSDFNDIRGAMYGKMTNTAQESKGNRLFFGFNYQPRDRAIYRLSSFDNIIAQSDRGLFDSGEERTRESDVNLYDNKHFDNFKIHRNALNEFHKIRRHLKEPRTSKQTNSIKLVMNRATYSSSQLSIKVSELHADTNGRLEISCVSTIPAKIGQGEMYADYKSYSVKIDVKTADPTTTNPPTVGMAALGGCAQIQVNIFNLIIFLVSQCLPFSIFYSFLSM